MTGRNEITTAGNPVDIHLVVSDMDGTLLAHDASIHDESYTAIRRLEDEHSIPFVLATGRCRKSALERLGTVGADWSSRPGIFLNGTVVHGMNGELIHQSSFPVSDLQRIVGEFSNESDSIVVQFCCGDYVLSPSVCEVATWLHREYADPFPTHLGSYDQMFEWLISNGQEVHMISILTAPGVERDVFSRLESSMPDGYCIVTAVPRQVAIMPQHTNKGTGVLALAKCLSIDPSNIAAIGDGNNDIPMLQVVGCPVAMGNAKDEVKTHAHHVVNRYDHPTMPGVPHFLNSIVFQSL
jgi:Cof subfamily protein (haloacid dehalogenase superfamily)